MECSACLLVEGGGRTVSYFTFAVLTVLCHVNSAIDTGACAQDASPRRATPKHSCAKSFSFALTAAMEQFTGPRDVREHVQAFMDSARPVAVIPQGTLLVTAGLGLLVMVLFGWGALTSFLRGLVTNMQNAIRSHMDTLVQELNEQTKKSLLLEIGNAKEEMQYSLTVKLENTAEAL